MAFYRWLNFTCFFLLQIFTHKSLFKALFKQVGLSVGFLPRPIVTQDRNVHSREADFDAELPLYTKAASLTTYLSENYAYTDRNKKQSFITMLENLWIDMYERGHVEEDDVINIQEWIAILLNIGYKFPAFPESNDESSVSQTSKYSLLNLGKIINSFGRRINQLTNDEEEKLEKKYEETLSDCKRHNITFGSSDLHDGSRIEIPSVLLNMGQSYVQLGPPLCRLKTIYCKRNPLLNHPEVMGLPGMITLKNPEISPILYTYDDTAVQIKNDWPNKIAKFYKDDPIIGKKMDAFICSFPSSMCQIWTNLNKSIIFLPAHRYNLGRTTLANWPELDKYISKLQHESIEKGHFVGAVSRYDIEYMKYYNPNLKPILLSSYAGFYMKQYEQDGVNRKEILIFKKRGTIRGVHPGEPFVQNVKEVLEPEIEAEWIYKLYNNYFESGDIIRHPAVIILPYSVMSYKFSELYSSAIPIFAPSLTFYRNFYDASIMQYSLGWDRTVNPMIDPRVERQMRRNQTSYHPYSPNVDYLEDVESEMYWLQYSDFYDWPHVQYFDDYQHLKHLLLNVNYKSISDAMKQELVRQRKQVTLQWCKVINNIKNRKYGKVR